MQRVVIPGDLSDVLDEAWQAASQVPGFLEEPEARFLGTVAACTPCKGAIVEIGSFKGKSTVMLAKVARHYGLDPVIAIDPHNFNSAELQACKTAADASTYEEFLNNVERAGVSDYVQPQRAFASTVAATWNAPIRFLWIDGDHTYQGAKCDFDGFFRHVSAYGIVALHDALHEFSGPLRVFVEEMLRSDKFGAAGFVGSIAWSQFRPDDGAVFQKEHAALERLAAPIVSLVKNDLELRGLRKIAFKLYRARVPRALCSPNEWAAQLAGRQQS